MGVPSQALSDIAKHSPELAQLVVDAGTCSLLVKDNANVWHDTGGESGRVGPLKKNKENHPLN